MKQTTCLPAEALREGGRTPSPNESIPAEALREGGHTPSPNKPNPSHYPKVA